MLQLQVFTQQDDNAPFGATATKAQYLELMGEDTIALNLQVSDVLDITSRRGGYSQTFKVPFTPNNDAFFEYAFDVNISSSTFNPAKKCKAIVLVNNIPQLNGYLQIKSVYHKSRQYEVVVFGDVADLANEVKDKKLREAFLDSADEEEYITTYNHYLNTDEIVNSFTGVLNNTAGVDTPSILYPIIDYATNLDNDGNVCVIYGSAPGGGMNSGIKNGSEQWAVQTNTLKPSMQIKEIWDLIFKKAGFRYTSTFLTGSYFTKLFMLLATEQDITTKPIGGFNVGIGADMPIGGTTSGVYNQELIKFSVISGGDFFDADSMWDTSNFTLTPLTPHKYKVRFNYSIKQIQSSGSESISANVVIRCYEGGVGGWMVSSGSRSNVFTHNTAISDEMSFIVNTPADGSTVPFVFTMSFEPIFGSTGLTNITSITLLQSGMSAQLEQILYPSIDGKEVLVPLCMPDVLQIDFVKAIIQRFNLVIEPDNADARHLYIEPFNDWLDSGSSVDWTNKLNLDKEFKISTTNEIQKKEIRCTDEEDDDLLNKAFLEDNGRVFGAYNYTNPNEFVEGELEIGGFFSPFLVSPLTDVDGSTITDDKFLIARHFTLDEASLPKPTTTKPKMFFYSGTPDTVEGYYFNGHVASDGWVYAKEYTTFPMCTAYDNTPITSSTKDLNFQSDRGYDYGGTQIGTEYTENNAFNTYWSRFINELYSSDARIMECELFLNALDINNLRYNQHIFIKDAFYRIDSIRGYVPGSKKSCKVKLIKLITKLGASCSEGFTASAFNSNGIVSFVNSASGASATITQKCCEELGYFWDTSNNSCYFSVGLGGSNTPKPPKPLPNGAILKSGSVNGVLKNQKTLGTFDGLQQNTNIFKASMVVANNPTFKNATAFQHIYTIQYYLYAYNNVGVAQTAYINGDTINEGLIQLPNNSYADIKCEAISVLKSSAQAPATAVKGSTERATYYGVVKAIDGTYTKSRFSEDTGTTRADTDAGDRVVDLSVTDNDGLKFTCTGYNTDAYTDFALKVEVTILPLSTIETGGFSAIYQNGDSISFQDGNLLEFN